MSGLFFDEEHEKMMTEEVLGGELRVGDTVILLCTDLNIIHHFKPYTGPLVFVDRIAKFTNGRGCSIVDRNTYKILKRV